MALSPSQRTFKARGICVACRRPMTQRGPSGECLRCLVSLAFLPGCEPPEQRSAANRRVTAGPLRYAHFEVEVGEDGFPIELGAGAMAVTYRARDTVLNAVVALKVIDRKAAENPAARSRFLREARAAAQLHHPNVARVTHYGEQDGECFYAMELVEGETLEARVRREGPMPLALALKIIEQAVRALAAGRRLRRSASRYQAIKPHDCFAAGRIGDSGFVASKGNRFRNSESCRWRIGNRCRTNSSGFIGTPGFRQPGTIWRRRPRGHRFAFRHLLAWSDALVFALWPNAFRRTDPRGNSRATGKDLAGGTAQAAHTCPATVVELLKSMLAIDPADRPQSARELLTAVASLLRAFRAASAFATCAARPNDSGSGLAHRGDCLWNVGVPKGAVFSRDGQDRLRCCLSRISVPTLRTRFSPLVCRTKSRRT